MTGTALDAGAWAAKAFNVFEIKFAQISGFEVVPGFVLSRQNTARRTLGIPLDGSDVRPELFSQPRKDQSDRLG